MKRSGFDIMSKWEYVWYILLHPSDGFQEMKYHNKGSIPIVCSILFLFFLEEAYRKLGTSFDFNSYSPESASLIMLVFTTIILFLIVVISNWCFCTLLDGKGSFKNICVVSAYALIPYILISFVVVTLTKFLTLNEGGFLKYITILSGIWSFFIAFCGLKTIHEYSFKKTILSVILTFFGTLIILFISFLIVMLFQQLFIFINTIWIEVSRR